MSDPVVKRRPMIDLEEFERRLRQPLATHQRDDDPLAELARLVGEQEDPYKSVFEPLRRRPAAPLRNSWDQEDEAPAQEPFIGGDFAAIEAGLLGATRHEDYDNLSEPDQSEFAETESWSYTGTSEPFPEADPADDEIRSRRPLYVMAAIIVAGIAGIGASFLFKGSVSSPVEVATIRAVDGPAKIHPDTATGTEVQSEDASVLGGTQQPQPVSAVSNIEQPADLSAQTSIPPHAESVPRVISGLPAGAASVPVPLPPGQAQAQPQTAPEPATIASLIQPKKVKTVSVRPDGTVLPNDTPPQVASGAPPVTAHPAAIPAAKAATPKSTARVATTPKPTAETDANGQAAKAASAVKPRRAQLADAREPTAAEAAPTSASGGFSVQLAAPGSEQEARDVQAKLMKKFGAELAGFHPSIHKAAVSGKPVYRVRVVGLSSRDEATALCQKIQSGGGNCFVAKN